MEVFVSENANSTLIIYLVAYMCILVACVYISFKPANNFHTGSFCSCFLPVNKTKVFVILISHLDHSDHPWWWWIMLVRHI